MEPGAQESTDLTVVVAVQKLKQQNSVLKSELEQLRESLQTTLKTIKTGEREQQRPNFSQSTNLPSSRRRVRDTHG